MKEYTFEEAAIYLVENSVYADEWTGAGMWEAVESLVSRKAMGKRITESWLKLRIESAKKF